MSEEDLIKYIKDKAHSFYNYWSNYESEIKGKVDMVIQYYQKDLKEENAVLKAKVYTYETIIANSNFYPILKDNKKKNGSKE